jgi:hypothetical protein
MKNYQLAGRNRPKQQVRRKCPRQKAVSAEQLPPDAIISDIKLKPSKTGVVLAARRW